MTKRTVLIFACFVLVSLLTRWLSLCVDILDIDEAAHIVGSWHVLRGEMLYTDFVDNKPPLLYFYYALSQILLGRGMFAVHLFTLLIPVPLTALGLSAFYGHSRTGVIAGLIFLVYSASFLAHDMLAVNAELLMILPGAWALVLIKDESSGMARIGSACLLIGLGFLLKYQVAFWLPAVLAPGVVYCIQRRDYVKACLAVLAGTCCFLIPPLAVYYLYQRSGGGQELLYWTILNNLYYSANPTSFRDAVGRAASYLLPFLIVTVPLWWLACKGIRGTAAPYRRVLLSALMLCSIPPVFIGFRFYPHYFIQLYVPLALAAAPQADRLLSIKSARKFVAYSISLLIVCTAMNTFLYFGSNVYRERDPVYKKVADRLRDDPCYSGARLFVWGYAPQFHYYSEIAPASRFSVLSQGGITEYISGNPERYPGRRNERSWDLLMKDLDETKCTYILDTSPARIYRWDRFPIHDYPRLHALMKEHFELMATVDQVDIYRRKDCFKGNP